MITFVEVSIGSGGVVRCDRCPGAGALREPRAAAAVSAALVDAAADWTHGPGPNVLFTGFEPFSHPELPLLIASATSACYRRIALRTDGGALASGGNARGAVQAGVRIVELVLLADGPAHDSLSARSGLFAQACSGAAAFRDAGRTAGARVALVGLVPVCKHNVEYAPAAVARLAALGAVAVRLEASGLDERHHGAVRAALHTAAVNGIAGYLTGSDARVPAPWAFAPWRIVPEVTA